MTDRKRIQVDLEKDEYERFDEVKDKYGLTWRGILLEGMRSVEERYENSITQ